MSHQNKLFPLSLNEKQARLRLIRTETIGPITFHTLLKKYESAEKALEVLPHLAKRGGRLKPLIIPDLETVLKEWQALEAFGGSFLFYGDHDYPVLLSYLEDAPPVLAVKGRVDLLHQPCLAMVGARNASVNGRLLARTFADDLGTKHFTIVSGLARGIDTAAHEGALKTGTIAVVAGGINIIYPPENKILFNHIASEGLIVAETPFGVAPLASSFPRRNRLISGLCQGLIIIEAALKSGSLITATYAAEQGRDVFAIPGFPLDPRCQGSNKLIQEGAHLVQNTEDIIKNLNTFKPIPLTQIECAQECNQDISDTTLEEGREKIKENLNFSPLHIDELIRACHMSPAEVHLIVLEMDVAGLICRHPGHKVSLRLNTN